MSGSIPSYGCIYVPDFLVQAMLRVTTDISFREDPVALLDGPDSLKKVFGCNEPARRAGIEPGMTKTEASVLPNIILRNRMIEQEQAAHSALMDCGYSFSPQIESTCPGTIILDLTGTERLLGTLEEIGIQLAARAAECGLEVHVGLAATPDTALHAARGFAGITMIHAGQEALRLACLPIEVLQPAAEVLETLKSWGIHDLKSLGRLPEISLSQRLGQYGLYLQQLARGAVRRKLVPAEPIARFQESLELEEAVELLEPLMVVLHRLLQQLTNRLAIRSLATDQVEVRLELELHPDRQLQSTSVTAVTADLHQRTLKLPVPTQDVDILLKLLQLDLSAHPPQAPVKKVIVELLPARIRFDQPGFFQPRAPEPAKLEITMAKLRAVVGERDGQGRNRVGFPVITDSHKPDSFEVLSTPPERKSRKQHNPQSVPRMVFRVFRPPIRAKVELAANVPAAILFQGTKKKVVNASGPWRKDGAWWDKAGEWKRDEWDVELNVPEGKTLYRLFCDRSSGEWFVEGMYD
jgi:protein ImuB